MIGKAITGGNISGLLNYCYYESTKSKKDKNVRGEYIFSQNVQVLPSDGRLNLSAIAKQFSGIARLNQNCTQPFWHQCFSFPKDENPSNEILEKITVDFALDFGFFERQMIAFRHYDKEHHHFHIIANRLDLEAKNAVKTSNNYYRINTFCRKIENKYGLKAVEIGRANKIDGKENPIKNKYADELRALIDAYLPNAQSIDEFTIMMQKYGYLIEKGRGITFVLPKNNIRIKGSDLGKEYSLSNLSKRLKGKFIPNFVKSSEIINLRRIIDVVLPKVGNYQVFKQKLQTQGYSVRLVEKDSKRDIKFEKKGLGCKFVLGSSLGDGYRMEDIQRRFNENSPMIKYDNNENTPLISDLLESSQANFQTEQDLAKIDQSLNNNKIRKGINSKKWGLKKKI
ncbi:MAG: relaxase/mobilization nuclease domain-containing protein [Emticicia sp.]|uniref:relaxase/mobilization nuclease domain-containing protein n=1 Tax=Emticicia sp. TaxID=1930953 RepID=UPI003BA49BE6